MVKSAKTDSSQRLAEGGTLRRGKRGNADDPDQPLRLADRLALRPAEAAAVLGLGERTLRQILRELPHVHVGSAVLIPVDQLREWLREQATAERSRSDAVAEEILRSFEPK